MRWIVLLAAALLAAFAIWQWAAGDAKVARTTGPRPAPELGDVSADGVAIPCFRLELAVPRRGDLDIRLPEEHEGVLVVVDARDGRPLSDVAVFEAAPAGDFQAGEWPPASAATLRRERGRTDAAGRFPLARGHGVARIHLFREGFAWRAVRVPLQAGGELVVELDPGGNLRLLVPRWKELRAPEIWARRESTGAWLRLPAPEASEEVLVRGLPDDGFEVTVRRGEWFTEGKVYGRVSARVRAGRTVTATVLVTPETPPVEVKVTGTVAVPPGWKEPPAWITFRGAEEATAEIDKTVFFRGRSGASVPGAFPFAIGPLAAGRYLVEIAPYQWATHVTVTDRNAAFSFSIPRAVNVRVEVQDGDGRAVAQANVKWHAVVPGRRSWSPGNASLEDGAHRFQAPRGEVVISAEAPGFLDDELTVDLREDRDLVLRLKRAGVVVVRLRVDGRPFDGAGTGVSLNAEGASYWRTLERGEARFDQLPPGRWRVEPDDIAGFEPVAPKEIDVTAGETREIAIDLVRKRAAGPR